MKQKKHMDLRRITLVGLVLSLAAVLFIDASITGYFIAQTNNYTDEFNLSFESNSQYLWEPEHQGQLYSVQVSGYLEGDSASVRLVDNLIYSYSGSVTEAIIIQNGSGDIDLDFSYDDDTAYIDDLIEFNVNASFDFNTSNSDFCTKYIITELEENLSTAVC